MKRFLTVLLPAIATLSLVACGPVETADESAAPLSISQTQDTGGEAFAAVTACVACHGNYYCLDNVTGARITVKSTCSASDSLLTCRSLVAAGQCKAASTTNVCGYAPPTNCTIK